ncbi:MAG: RluA family pseudouridine synthase [Spirochaetes bacterium]|nr:RluA family pseudouridine synthase [Spirochaetota bacterium]
MKIRVIFEDNHIIVAEKPVNVPSQRDESNNEDMLTLLKKDIRERFAKPGNVYLGLVHRLDRPAGGIMVFAKTSKAASRLSGQMRAGSFKKKYLAILHGKLKETQGKLRHFLLKDERTNIVSIMDESIKNAKLALLSYEFVEHKKGLSLVKVDLITGRPHQIRAQFACIGNPLWGDQKYGSDINRLGQQLALWSAEIAFVHPVSNEELSFTSSPPAKEPWNLFDNFRMS